MLRGERAAVVVQPMDRDDDRDATGDAERGQLMPISDEDGWNAVSGWMAFAVVLLILVMVLGGLAGC